MPKVICIMPHASDSINGVKFTPHPKGKISEDVPKEVADNFLSIRGYVPENILDNAEVELPKKSAPEPSNFQESSFQDSRAKMPEKLLDASPGFEKAPEPPAEKQDDAPPPPPASPANQEPSVPEKSDAGVQAAEKPAPKGKK